MSAPCAQCQKPALEQCGACKGPSYCSKICQINHWKTHKPICKSRVAVLGEDKKSSEVAQRVLQPKQGKCDITKDAKLFASVVRRKYAEGHKLSKEMNDYTKDAYDCPYINKLAGSAVRSLMCLAFFYFDGSSKKLHDYCATIPGVDVVKSDVPGQCSTFVFGKTDWFKNNPSALSDLHGFYGSVIKYLNAQGYQKVKEPQVGDVVAYATHLVAKIFTPEISDEPSVTHYGRVIEIKEMNGKKEIVVESKFVEGPVFRHRLEHVLHIFGPLYVFLREKT